MNILEEDQSLRTRFSLKCLFDILKPLTHIPHVSFNEFFLLFSSRFFAGFSNPMRNVMTALLFKSLDLLVEISFEVFEVFGVFDVGGTFEGVEFLGGGRNEFFDGGERNVFDVGAVGVEGAAELFGVFGFAFFDA